MAYDTLDTLQALTTVSATTSGTGLDFLSQPGTPRRGLVARVLVPTQSAATSGAVVTFIVQGSSDNTNWYNVAQAIPLTLGAVSNTLPPIHIPFNFLYQMEYARLQASFSTTTGTPLLAYSSQIGIAWP